METDEQIYLRYKETDDDADLEALLSRHREGLLLFLLGFVHNAEDAEEEIEETAEEFDDTAEEVEETMEDVEEEIEEETEEDEQSGSL